MARFIGLLSLLVVPLVVDSLALLVLCLLNAPLFIFGHFTILSGLFLQVLHVFLAFFEAPSFFLGYLAFFDAPFDTLVLLFLPLIDARRGLRERVYRHC